MNTASLELCKELYELSGWDDTYFEWFIDEHGDEFTREPSVGHRTASTKSEIFNFIAAYDSGYLLRKLPRDTILSNISENGWTIVYGAKGLFKADTPENAACKLAITLFKEKVLV